ncbi:hypothetical protein KIW84_050772 [Lathyrus oleraceus]|uniref:Uncharacterized protein n=1 Tax=Pisum sativum TaxID=3888 RepID=A0A9D4VTD8_PEA|nr:hypothetical protein KIW84_074659 [Pisum sativum]KAI5403334.1 hypothetical protein KIW84_050771 [Pisum sativum]KAI5403335.1 hypothetical protein KIW84_050772 [Pisum sativum]
MDSSSSSNWSSRVTLQEVPPSSVQSSHIPATTGARRHIPSLDVPQAAASENVIQSLILKQMLSCLTYLHHRMNRSKFASRSSISKIYTCKVSINDEGRDVWKVYLDLREYAAALANCRDPFQRDQVTLKFISAGEQDALRTFLLRKLDNLEKG